jgi:hypothetical protein
MDTIMRGRDDPNEGKETAAMDLARLRKLEPLARGNSDALRRAPGA